MIARDLYDRLEADFITEDMRDVWDDVKSIFISENFRTRKMGVVCDFAEKINKVYTAVFPSKRVLQKIIDDGTTDAMLFVHHPMIWDIRKAPDIFHNMDEGLLAMLKERRVAIYNLHVPLDNFGDYSTSVTLAKAIGINPEKSFAYYYGAMAGVFGSSDATYVWDLKERFATAVGHDVVLYNYGPDELSKVAVIAGGGNGIDMLEEISNEGANVLVTGITRLDDYSRSAHEFAKEKKINILGGTHYSTEKFACLAMLEYFRKHDLDVEFVSDIPIFEDM